MTRPVYRFKDTVPGGDPRDLLGGKGAGLSEMTRLGLPVPPGFTITTGVCNHFRRTGSYPEDLRERVAEALASVEEDLGRRFGDAADPLLLSVRSGSRFSMPGMMDTILNVGLNRETVQGLAKASEDARFAFDAYRRLIQMYGDVVLGVSHDRFAVALRQAKAALGDERMSDAAVPAEALEALCERFHAIVEEQTGEPFPDDPHAQLWGAVDAVFRSWSNTRAVRYRRMHGIPDDLGTACNIQAMVFGNLGEDSGSGVVFTRNPSNGERALYGEYLVNAQGEDVVAGIRTPIALTASATPPGREGESLERRQPEAFAQLVQYLQQLEAHFRDMQDVELTVERGKVWILQTRTGKRTAHAAVKVAVDLVREGSLEPRDALMRVQAESLDQLLHARLPSPEELAERGIRPLASGLPASPGAASGLVVFDADEAERLAGEGRPVILMRRETSPEDIHGMKAARGVVTATGGMTSHAAVVARGLGTCCVAGCGALEVDSANQRAVVRTDAGAVVELAAGDVVTLDGSHGLIYQGEIDVVAAATIPEFDTLMEWADAARRLHVRANADTPEQATEARRLGAEGIGLCRTEHMFFAEDRLAAVRCMVLTEDPEDRTRWLSTIEPMQREDFAGMFRAMAGLEVTIRLLDWPLHEFLPREEPELEAVAKALGVPVATVRARAARMSEVNPMLGHRGVRVGLLSPEIYRMQVRAVVAAAAACLADGVEARPQIMIPVVGFAEELGAMRDIVEQTLAAWLDEHEGPRPAIKIGTMIELPRACVVADDMAAHAEFFSFGTNDLTQTTLGISRDDAGRFLPAYVADERGLMAADPFARIDRRGVGALMRMAVERGRARRPDIELGVCGEHGGDPDSIDFCHGLGLHYVSCSPPRLPIARLAAAQAAIREPVR